MTYTERTLNLILSRKKPLVLQSDPSGCRLSTPKTQWSQVESRLKIDLWKWTRVIHKSKICKKKTAAYSWQHGQEIRVGFFVVKNSLWALCQLVNVSSDRIFIHRSSIVTNIPETCLDAEEWRYSGFKTHSLNKLKKTRWTHPQDVNTNSVHAVINFILTIWNDIATIVNHL